MNLVVSHQPLFEILRALRLALRTQAEISFLVPNPDLGVGLHAGEVLENVGVHRPFRLWMDVADRLECHFLTPQPEGDRVRLRLRQRAFTDDDAAAERSEKYGPDTAFGRVRKLEDACFLEDALEALARVRLPPGARILDLGVNTGEELKLLELAYPGVAFDVVGVDHSESAIAEARRRFPQHRFEVLDIGTLPQPALGKFDLVFSVGTLQSPGLNQDHVFRALVREHMLDGGAFILGFPNCRYEAGEVVFGARMKNYRQPDLSLLIKDLAYYKRYFQRHEFKVFVTGKYDVFVTAFPERTGPRRVASVG